MSDMDSLRTYLREHADEPYMRGPVGPSGYDCSGLVEAWRRAFGDPSVSLPIPR